MKHKKHVVYILTKLELGGAQKVCLMLLDQLKQKNFGVTLLTSSGILDKKVIQKHDVLFVKELNSKFQSPLKEWRAFKQIVTYLKKLKKQHPNLLVHTHSTKAGLLGRWAAWWTGIKIRIHTVHGFGFHKHQNMFLWSFVYLLEYITSSITTHFVCVSWPDVATGKKLLPGFIQKHSIIRAAIEWDTFYKPARIAKPFPEKKQPFIFGTIACFKPQKNLFDLLTAFKYIHKHTPHTRLEIIGDGALRPKIKRWLKEKKLEGFVLLHGWQENVAPIMERWHAFVLSSLWEGLPCSIIEARLLQLPILSYNTGGISDVVKNNVNGLLFEQHDWVGLAQGMLELARTKPLFNKLQPLHEDLQNFNPEVMGKQHITLYDHYF